jgi:hypothetical protein
MRLSSSLGFRLRMRKGGGGNDETFTGFVRRIMRGDRGTEEERVGTLTWWMERNGEAWKEGGAVEWNWGKGG